MDSDRERVLFEASPTAMLLLTPEGTVAGLNHAARKTLGAAPDRLLNKPILLMVVPEDRDRVRDLFLRVLQGQTREWTTRFKRGDGATRVQWIRAVPLPENGRVASIVMFTRDITASREGRPETVQLQTLLENLPGQFTAVLDRDGRLRYSSGFARTHFRADVDLIGTLFSDLLSEQARPQAELSELLKAAREGEHWAGVQWHRRVDGTDFPVRTFSSPYMDPRTGRVLGALVAGRDVGAEYDWRARAERSQCLAGIGEVVADVAEALELGLARVQDALGQEGEAAGPDEVIRLRAFAHSLGAFADIATVRPERLVLQDLVRAAAAKLAGHGERLGATISVHGPDEPIEVSGTRDMLVRMGELLIENALDTATEGERSEVVVEVEVTMGPSGPLVHVRNPHVLEEAEGLHRAFEPLFSTKPGRAGLGLALARAIAQAHGGRIWSDHDKSGRVVFSALVPHDGAESKVRFRPVPLTLARTRTVLVVDDEDSVRTSVRRFLEKVGFEVREAWSGRSALAQITAGQPPELVLTDLRMSDGSGQWFLEELSRDFPDLLRRTVIITGDPDRPEVAGLIGETGCPVLGKPVEMPELLELLDEVALRN